VQSERRQPRRVTRQAKISNFEDDDSNLRHTQHDDEINKSVDIAKPRTRIRGSSLGDSTFGKTPFSVFRQARTNREIRTGCQSRCKDGGRKKAKEGEGNGMKEEQEITSTLS
jgi:hypothetical protein